MTFWVSVAVSPSSDNVLAFADVGAFGVLAHRDQVDVLGKRDLVFGNDFAGRTLAYRSKRLRSSTLIEGKPSPTGVVSGLFSAMRLLA